MLKLIVTSEERTGYATWTIYHESGAVMAVGVQPCRQMAYIAGYAKMDELRAELTK